MPNTYKSTAVEATTTGSLTIYSASAGTTALLKSMYIANVTTGSIQLDVIMRKSGSSIDYTLISSASIPTQTTFQPIVDTLVLQTGDSIRVATAYTGSADIVLSYLEIT